MSFDEGLGIFLWVLFVIWVFVVITNYRRGKWSLAMTSGLILLWFGVAADVPLPSVAPSLAFMHSKASLITTLGLLIILVSMVVDLRKKNKQS